MAMTSHSLAFASDFPMYFSFGSPAQYYEFSWNSLDPRTKLA
jgi:hypothetical protein